jgi:hypothetical protein
MILHDFIYEWDGKTRSGEKPVSWWPGSYYVKIIKLGSDSDNIRYLFSTAVVLKNARTQKTMNTSLRNYIDNFAKKIAKKYDLNISKTIWVEIDDEIRVASLKPDQKVVPEILYSISWRPIRPSELKILQPYIDTFK